MKNPPYFVRSGPISWDDVPPSIRRHAAALGLTTPPPPGARSLPPGPSPLTPLPRGFPRRLPADGRVRVGVLSPCCFLGGADLWVTDLLASCDPARIAWSGVAIRDDGLPIVPEVRASWEAHAPVAVGPRAIRALAEASDVLVAWGAFQSWGFPAGPLAPAIGRTPLLVVSHGSLGSCLDPEVTPSPFPGQVRAAAVSRAALRGLPKSLRASARVILNAVSPDRVRPTRPASETRALLGIPDGARVAGWLSRISGEKRPEVFARAIARLPREWVAVVAGIGSGEASMRALAAQVAPGRAIFLGARHDVGDVLASFDVGCMPTESEACSLSAAECWLAGVPLVSTRAGLLEEHPELARLIPNPPSPADLAAAILADHADRDGTAARVATAREFAGDHLGPGRFAREWTDVICSMAPPIPATIPLDRSIELMRLRRECPHASKAGGCGCQDLVACSKNNRDMTRPECYACLGADA